MNILLFHPNSIVLEMIAFGLESQLELAVFKTTNYQEAIDRLLGDEPVDLVITSLQDDTDKFFKYLLSSASQIPLILITQTGPGKIEAYPDLKPIAKIPHDKVQWELQNVIRKNFHEIMNSGHRNDYVQIHVELLTRFAPLKSDVHIRLSNIKYIKLFKAGAVFTKQDLENFLFKKKIQYLYIKKSESQEFVSRFQEELNKMAGQEVDDPALMDRAEEAHILLRELSDRMGFTPQVQEIAKKHVQLTIKAIGESPQLSKALAQSHLKERNYLSSHSVLLANISCSIAQLMEWPSDSTFHKLVLASLFHDFVFHDVALSKIKNKADLEAARPLLSPEDFDMVFNHPKKSAELVKAMKEIPGEVDFVILEHHERPDGTGFPQGLQGFQITPLSAVFIVAHNLIDDVARQGGSFNLHEFLQLNETLYQTGPFKKIWKLLAQCSSYKEEKSA